MVRTLVVVLLAAFLAVGSANKVNPANANRTHSAVCGDVCQNSQITHLGMNKAMPLKQVEFDYCRIAGFCPTTLKSVTNGVEACTNGVVGVHQNVEGLGNYGCNNVDLAAYVSASDLGSAGDTSDIWGATLSISVGDETVDKFVAVVCHSDGTSFVDITDSLDPIILGFLPTYDCGKVRPGKCAKDRIWRDVKVYGDKAFIVSENYGHGMQVVDMAALYEPEAQKKHARVSAGEAPTTITADHHYSEFGRAHNIALNEGTGYAYVIGSTTCSGGLHIIDVASDPPAFAGCFAEDGYTHDCQCLIYDESFPDARYHGREICFNYNEDTLTIVDVTDKEDMVMISRISYNGAQYTHQGWLTEDGKYLLLDDELDEQEGTTYSSNQDTVLHGGHTRTLIWNVENLETPVWETSYHSTETAIDHNLYILDNLAYQSNYCAGVRVMDVTNPLELEEVAYFDLAPYCSGTSFQGSWSNYPYYDHPDNYVNGVQKYQIVVATSIERGLYVLRVNK